jgi:flagellar biosynthesis/type III secretory pathway ATPase
MAMAPCKCFQGYAENMFQIVVQLLQAEGIYATTAFKNLYTVIREGDKVLERCHDTRDCGGVE